MRRKFALLTLALLLSFALAGSRPAQGFCDASVSGDDCLLMDDGGSGGGSGGGGGWTTYCARTCARQCPNGYWSSIGCLSNECAFCPCPADGSIPTPYCRVM